MGFRLEKKGVNTENLVREALYRFSTTGDHFIDRKGAPEKLARACRVTKAIPENNITQSNKVFANRLANLIRPSVLGAIATT